MWKVFDTVSNLLFYIISNLNPHCSDANLQESRQLRKLVKIAWAFTPGGCTDVDAGPDNNMVNLEKTWVCRYYRAARWDKENGPRWCKSPKDGGVKSYKRRAYIWVGYLGRGRNSWKMFKAKFGRDVKNAVLSLLLMARKIISFTSGTVNTIMGIGIEIFCICVKHNYFPWGSSMSLFTALRAFCRPHCMRAG